MLARRLALLLAIVTLFALTMGAVEAARADIIPWRRYSDLLDWLWR